MHCTNLNRWSETLAISEKLLSFCAEKEGSAKKNAASVEPPNGFLTLHLCRHARTHTHTPLHVHTISVDD